MFMVGADGVEEAVVLWSNASPLYRLEGALGY